MARFARPFKPLLLLLHGMLACYTFVFAQAPGKQLSAEDKAKMENAMRKIQRPSLNLISSRVVSPGQAPPSITANKFIPQKQTAQRSKAAACDDSSFLKIFEAANRSYSFSCSEKTKDGGMLIGGYGRNLLTGPPYIWSSVVSKFDSIGNHIWSKELRSNANPGIYVESMSEMSDGSIVLNGWHDNPLSTTLPTPTVDFFVAKLTATGDLLWLKTFHSLLGDGCTISNIRYTSIAEGANGDFFVGGTVTNCPLPKYLVVMKFNSLGVMQWNYSFADPEADDYCMGIFYEGNYVTVFNRSYEGGAIHVDLLRLAEATGAYISHKAWKPDLPYPASFYAGFLNWTPQVLRLNNGNYCVYGQTLGEYSFTDTDMPHFAVLEFDNAYNYVKGYTINSTLSANVYDNKIQVDRFGRVVYCMTTFTDPLDKTKHIGAADNGTIVHQRKKTFPNQEVFYDNVELFDDGSYVYIHNIATPDQANFYLYYSLLHNTDTSSLCLGLADNFSYTAPIQYVPHNFNWALIDPDFLIETNNSNNSVVSLNYTASPPCFQKSFCDTVKIHGNKSSCNLQQPFTFTAFKNKECGSQVSWSMDTSAIQSFELVGDTTLKIVFAQPWQGWLHAEISTSCGIAKDSLLLTAVSASPGAVNLGPDRSICTGNAIQLNARKGYAAYRWNNGSVDSLLTVTVPGKYYVDVTDACGIFFSDTVIVSPAPPIAFDIGPDRLKCNQDTLHLAAPTGFLNYTWGPAYNINTNTGRQVVVNPDIDTFYFVKAEKTAGCFAYDTIKIKVNYSPVIDLGDDISFCTGAGATLVAPAGFDQYQWSDGSLSQQVYVNAPGVYSVIGTTVDGCQSYDAVEVVNVWPNPVVTLDHDPGICIDATRILQPGNYTSYLWQDGSTGPSFTATGTGTYYVTVLDNHQCTGSDTVRITNLLPAPAHFLPADTAICNYGSFLLQPSGNYASYTWSNNAASPSISIAAPGIYWLQVKDANNCTGRDSILIGLKECLKGFYIPTAFTPDNNGLNDIFKPVIGGVVKQYQFTIYNRWGQLVFTTKELYKGWDGTFGGIAQDMNVFAWTCTYQLEGEAVKLERGTVVVVR